MSEEYTPTCKDCQLRFSGRCSQLSDDPCNSFLFHQTIDAEEKKDWPPYGDATAFILGEKR